MIASLYLLGIRYRFVVAAAVVLLTLASFTGFSKLVVDTSFNSLIPQDEPGRLIYQRVTDEFGSDNKTVIYVQDEDLWTVEKLTRLEQLQRELKGIRNVARVDSLFTLRTIEGKRDTPQDPPRVLSVPVLEGVPDTDLEADDARQRALANPLYIGNLFSEEGDVTAVIVTAIDKEDEEDFSLKLYDDLENVLGNYRGDFVQLFQVGPPRVNAELQVSLTDDFRVLGPLSALVLVASILIFMRSVIAAAVPLITSGITIMWTFGVMGWWDVPLNILSAMIPSLIIVIGSTEDTHMMAAFFRGLAAQRDKGDEPTEEQNRQAVAYMAKHTGLPLLLTVLTTGLGFASNLFSSIALIQDFAVASTTAIVLNGFVTILVVPPLLGAFGSFGVRESSGEELQSNNLPDRVVSTFQISQDNFPLYTLSLTFLMCLFFTFHASYLYVTNDPMSYFPEDRPLIQDTRKIQQELAGVKVFFISLDAGEEKAFLEPENLKKLDEIQAFMRKQDVFDKTVSIADHLKYVNREFEGRFAAATLPKTRQLVAQYLLFFQRSELESYVSHDFSRANIVVRHGVNDSHTLNQYVGELKDAVAQISGPTIRASVIGENLLVNQAAEDLMVSQVKALGLLLGLIFIIMSIMFTSFKGGAIAMVPSVIPIVLMFGIMGFAGIPLNPGTAMVAVIAVGIAIDGTIHLLARYNELCRSTSDYEGAVRQAVEEVAAPLIVSSTALALGFGILLFSNFTVVAQFGALAAATMLISIFANLLITPILMARIRLVGLYQIVAMHVDKEVLDKSPLFAGMSNYMRRKAILISELHEYEPGEKLVEQGTTGRSMYMILEGEADVIRTDNGAERKLATLEAGQIFGEIGYIRATERTADVVANSHVSLLCFDYARMQKDLKYFPNIVAQLNFNISGILGERLADVLAEGQG
jgi:predicted RND superfamily exporter protein